MDKKNYIDTLKNLSTSKMKKIKVEKKEVILNEQEASMDSIHNKIKDFFRKNPNPNDTQIKDLAKKWKMSEDELEDHIYMILTNYMKKYDSGIKENLNIIQELFMQTSEIESIPSGADRDMQILRLGMIAELDASNLYDKLAMLAKDKKIKTIMLDVSQEEKVHAGEFEALLEEIDPEYESAEDEGEGEVEDKT